MIFTLVLLLSGAVCQHTWFTTRKINLCLRKSMKTINRLVNVNLKHFIDLPDAIKSPNVKKLKQKSFILNI